MRLPSLRPVVGLLSLVVTAVVAATGSSGSVAVAGRAAGCGGVTVVLVHGAWADASSWSGEVSRLQGAGCAVRAIANPVEDLTTDAAYVADFLRSVPAPVVLVGHSYGGSVITNAAALVSNVKGLVYVDAAAPAVGETTGALSGSGSVLSTMPAERLYDMTASPGAGARSGRSELYLKEDVFTGHFASDLPKAQARLLWASQRGASSAAFDTPSRFAAWQKIPSWYFISSNDEIITARSELAMAGRARSRVTLFHGGSHLTLVSHPQAVTDVVFNAVRAVRR
ncbi:alpha/beta fold hydrolase [Dactylosporangium sp. NPDC051541]|uniref:alpha/beta fold hydrolase n=1 Tax=Dactylosporangium sp. NPDC051541 TaxID=3363977 RepID=UPI0037A35882